jgi:phosphoadenosine phosphosulfate reductase
MSEHLVTLLNEKCASSTSLDVLFDTLIEQNLGKIAFSTSLGQEDQVITHHIATHNHPIEVFTLDTGRLFQETYDVLAHTQQKYNLSIKVYTPEHNKVASLVSTKGPNSFYTSVENRKECFSILKIDPLKRALKGKKVWITGLRQAQSANRNTLDLFSYDPSFDIIKFNPLRDWSLDAVNDYLETNRIPQNTLHKKGFISVGCAPCTRAIEPDEDIRAGRWWWESSKKECGLHTSKS